MRKMTISAIVLFALGASGVARAETASISEGQLTGEITYWFVGHLGQVDDKGRMLVWEAEVAGDFRGTMKWWFEDPPPSGVITYAQGRLTFYAARWEFWEDGELQLAGTSAGKTDFRGDSDGVWDGHGRVTEASGKYESLTGRSVYETGPVFLGSDPPKSFTGTGMFSIF